MALPPAPQENHLGKFEVGTVVRLRKTNELALITDICYLKDRKNFLNYLAIVEGRGEGTYALYDSDIELECLPEPSKNL